MNISKYQADRTGAVFEPSAPFARRDCFGYHKCSAAGFALFDCFCYPMVIVNKKLRQDGKLVLISQFKKLFINDAEREEPPWIIVEILGNS